MCNFLRSTYIKVLCCYLALFMAGLIPGPEMVWASFLHHQQEGLSEMDQESMEDLRVILENELIREKLSVLGLSSAEIIHRIEQLSTEERQIILEELQSVQLGGNGSEILIWIGILLYILVEIGEVVGGYVNLFKDIASLGGEKKAKGEKEAKKDRPGVTFDRANDIYFPPYEGWVKVLIEEEPEEKFIYTGTVNIRSGLAITNEKSRNKILLKWMKEEAAYYGADTIILSTSEPERDSLYPRHVWHWSARAFVLQRWRIEDYL
jgi:hypothetical protein